MFAVASNASCVIAPSTAGRRAAGRTVVAAAAAGPVKSSKGSKFAGNSAAALRATSTSARLGGGSRHGRGSALVVQANLFQRFGRVIGSYANSLAGPHTATLRPVGSSLGTTIGPRTVSPDCAFTPVPTYVIPACPGMPRDAVIPKTRYDLKHTCRPVLSSTCVVAP